MTFSILDMTFKGGTLSVNMHELVLTQNILNLALKHAGLRQIKHVNLSIGEFSDEREEAIRFHWEEAARGTPAQGAEVHFRRVEAEMKCLACKLVFHPNDENSLCPSCGSHRLQLLSGDDVQLESIDVE